MNETWTTTHDDRVELYRSRRLIRPGLWRFRVVAPNGEVLEWGEGYQRRIDAVTAAERHHPRVEP